VLSLLAWVGEIGGVGVEHEPEGNWRPEGDFIYPMIDCCAYQVEATLLLLHNASYRGCMSTADTVHT
jgi:hypothetical protein